MTEEYNIDLQCIGCGAMIQTEDKNKEGFIPSSALESRGDDEIYCQRCFRLRHYNDPMDIELDEDQFLAILNEVSIKKALIVMVVDIFDFEGSFIQGIQRFSLDNPLMIVANKIDLLPKSIKRNRIKHWVTTRAHNLGVRPDYVEVVSSLEQDSVRTLMNSIEEARNGMDVYIVGATNVGKSSLVNQMIGQSVDDQNVITTSYFPGTTLGKIEIPLDDGSLLVDTPGIIQKHQLSYQLDEKGLKTVTPNKEIRPRSYQLNEGQTLFFGGLGRMDVERLPGKSSFVVYAAQRVKIHRSKTENADKAYTNLKGKELTPPFSPDVEIEWTQKTFKIKEATDVIISGLAFVHVPAGSTLTFHAPEGVGIYLRPSLIG